MCRAAAWVPPLFKKATNRKGETTVRRSDVNSGRWQSGFRDTFHGVYPILSRTRPTRSRAVPAQSERTVAVPRTYLYYCYRTNHPRMMTCHYLCWPLLFLLIVYSAPIVVVWPRKMLILR